jgi:predicted nuclease of predicted toxin-antitoxin system
MLFFCDVHIPPRLVSWLRQRGHQAFSVFDFNLETAKDAQISAFIAAKDGIVITKDSDFSDLHGRGLCSRLIWVRTGNCSTDVLLAKFQETFDQAIAYFETGGTIVELR